MQMLWLWAWKFLGDETNTEAGEGLVAAETGSSGVAVTSVFRIWAREGKVRWTLLGVLNPFQGRF